MISHHTHYKQKLQYQQGDEVNFSKTNLFFIKSKHVFKNFKNHDYFETKAHNRHKAQETKEFVGYPTPYGFNNAYKYLCEQIANKNIKSLKFNHQKLQTEGQHLFKSIRKQIITQKRSRTHYTLPNLTENITKMESLHLPQEGPESLNIKQRLSEQRVREGKSEMIEVMFVDQERQQQKCIRYEVKLNIYNEIISTFIKSRINYNDLTHQQFGYIKDQIIKIYSQQREIIEYKDIVNMKTVKDVFKLIEERNDPLFTKETLRYFFISSIDIYEYHLNKIKDQIKNLINYQFNQEISQEDIYLYSLQGQKITNLYEMMRHSKQTFICGIHKDVYQIYEKQEYDKKSKKTIINRINKWKSSIPSSTHEQIYNKISTSSANDHRYNMLFESVKKKRCRQVQNKKRQVISLKSSQFIDKDKLSKNQNIFQ